MIFLERILICELIIASFMTYAMAECRWIRNHPSNNQYCPTSSNPYEAYCMSRVTYENALSRCEKNNEMAYDFNIKITLANPDESPFLENVTYFTELIIKDGYLVTIPKDIYNMTKLRYFKISGNKMRKINLNDFLPLQSLKIVNLANNKIIVLETIEKFSNYSTIQDIDVSFNYIEAIPKNFIKSFNYLEHLNMSHNMISSIDKHAFEGAVELKTLDLSHNRLQEVGNIFVQLPRLIDSDYATSNNFQKLSLLVLDHNFIDNIDFTFFFDTGIPELSIGGNQIPCNELARIKYSKFSEKFDRIVTAAIFNFDSDNINGISCLKANNDIRDVLNVSDNPSSNSSILVTLLKNAVENNSKTVTTLIEIINQNEKKLEQLLEITNSLLSSINIHTQNHTVQLTDIKNNLPDKSNVNFSTMATFN